MSCTYLYLLLSFFFLALCTNGTLTGDQYNTEYFTCSVTLNDVDQTATITLSGTSSIGWISVGTGTKMLGSDMIVVWPRSDRVNVVYSRRLGTGHTLPSLISNQSAVAQTNPSTPAIQNNVLSVTFTRPLVLPESTLSAGPNNLIWAYDNVAVGSDSASAPFSRHSKIGIFSLDLSKPTTAPITNRSTAAGPASAVLAPAGPVAEGPVVTMLSTHDVAIITHAVFMFAAWGICVPLGVYIARFGRNIKSWVNTHQKIQTYGAGGLTFAGFWLGFVQSGTEHFKTPHQIIGLTLSIALYAQLFLGWLIHHLYNPERTRRPARNYGHMILGFSVLIMSCAQIPLGLQDYGLPDAWNKAYYVWLGVLVLLFVALSVWKIVGERKAAHKMQPNGSDNSLVNRTESETTEV
ncbi:hypothetical protein BC938DRAFT_480942 [Jimgerdemannia flammicorona]|uniref:Cytochrome b561 domain-containing protein n=1 Tax=Jimgerdemannia flammicorona TaxID=994334 RepID=A0A433QH73_9FUNG|nr:hypothetical protein BC938DRAFT_480942 [Jimgerdemannia flammicorona]